MTDRRPRRDDPSYVRSSIVVNGRTVQIIRRRPDERPLHYSLPAHLQGPVMLHVLHRTFLAIAAGANHDDDDTAVRSTKRARVAGATEAAVQGLPVVTPSSKLLLTQAECAVCLTDFEADDNKLRAMPCAHVFHEQCIFQWLRCKASCPLCRQHLPPTTTKDKDDNKTALSPAAAQPEDPILCSVTRQDD